MGLAKVVGSLEKRRRTRQLKQEISRGRRFIRSLEGNGPLASMPTRLAMAKDHAENHIRELEQELQRLQSI